jgi:hypothetical protein
MSIDAADFFYLSMPKVEGIGDGSQDALVVRITADGVTGWGECEASPLVSIAAFVTPMTPDANGGITLPAPPGRRITVNPAGMRPYLVDVEIAVKGRTL